MRLATQASGLMLALAMVLVVVAVHLAFGIATVRREDAKAEEEYLSSAVD